MHGIQHAKLSRRASHLPGLTTGQLLALSGHDADAEHVCLQFDASGPIRIVG
jgi:hypothetical protein